MQKYPVRQSQLISTWGVGQIIPFPDGDNLMIAGLDAWEIDCYRSTKDGNAEFDVLDARLARRLGVNRFRKPPDYREPGKRQQNENLKIPAVRFPQWHYCPVCGYMQELSLYSTNLVECKKCNVTRRKYRPILMPIYFIAVCEKGHIEDFPFYAWVHNNSAHTESCELTLTRGLNIQISCTCGAQRSMSNIYQDSALSQTKTCGGSRPWLGEVQNSGSQCGSKLKVLQIGASNVYFPIVVSSIFLPTHEEAIRDRVKEIIQTNWHSIAQTRETGDDIDAVLRFLGRTSGLPVEQLRSALHAYERQLSKYDNLTEEDYRNQEYQAISNHEGNQTDEFYAKEFPIKSYGSNLKGLINRVICIHKLRETRAFVGFSRLFPQEAADFNSLRENLMYNKTVDWLPAYINRGEGIFLELPYDVLNKWYKQAAVQRRFDIMLANSNKERDKRKRAATIFDPRFALLHTFAHILIRQLAFVSGYNAASIRERIYWGRKREYQGMNGLLIYTASSDSEGSLGGLVHQGKPGNLEPIIMSALQAISWCSADPVCIESKGQGVDGSNLGACHNCALLPETSCENGNRLLDRGLLIGINGDSELGYFSRLL